MIADVPDPGETTKVVDVTETQAWFLVVEVGVIALGALFGLWSGRPRP